MYRRNICVIVLAVAAASRPSPAADLPEEFALRPGESVLFLGDSIVGPGMYSYVANSLLERLYPGQKITCRSFGIAGSTAKSILPHLPKALGDARYDWIVLNFGHNDSGQCSADEFKANARTLIREIRKLSQAKLAWMSVLGSEPSPFAGEPGQEGRKKQTEDSRTKQKIIAHATQELAKEERILYLPTHEAFSQLLEEREVQKLPICFTYDGVHPNLLGNWILGASILQCLGLKPAPVRVEVLQSDATCDQGRLPVRRLDKPLAVDFENLFLKVNLIPAADWRAVAVNRAGIVLDGDLEDWEGIAEHRIAAPLHVTWELVPGHAAEYAAAMRTCHDAKNLYFAFEVKEPNVDEGAWFPEIIEVFLDGRKDTTTPANMWRGTPGLTQFAFHRDFTGKAGTANAKVMTNGDTSQGEGLKAAAKRSAEGYVLEAAIPLSNFKQIKIEQGTVLPLDWAVSFTDQVLNLDWLGLMGRSANTMGYGVLVIE